jgi:putative membrane protein
VWLFFAATVYLILVEAVRPWVHLPDLGNIGFTMVFVLFAILHCAVFEGWRRTGVFFLISAMVSYAMEEIGVRTGAIYGPYHYSEMLGAKLGHVPILIPLAWFMMIYPSWMVARWVVARGMMRGGAHSLGYITELAVIAAFVMTAWDTVMDPGMAAAGNWVWEQGGPYFGVPLRNYFGWMLTTFFVYWIAGFAWRGVKRTGTATPGFEALPVVVYAFFALRYVMAGSIPALQLVALFSMGLPALLALMQIATRKNEKHDEA